MAETLTLNTDPDSATNVENLTPEEQDSLQIGEQMVAEQEQLLAGKYKNAEELEKAYVELQKKIGGQGDEASETTGNTESSETKTDSEETNEANDYSEGYLEDGAVNYDIVNEAYGEQLGNIFKNADVDPWAISKHFHENNGTVTDEMFNSLVDAGLSKESVTAYLDGRAVESGYTENQTTDVSQADIDSIKKSVGGETEYNNLVSWAGQNLDKKSIEGFDSIIETGNPDAIKMAVSGLKSQYENANGYEGRMLTGKAPKSSGDVFRSQAELVAAMSDSRYDNDPAYRQDIIEKLDRSDMNF
tara:strand:+ start:598 stop:1503 length:906 start_codon:yes stop_codon:yes gene_type:complete